MARRESDFTAPAPELTEILQDLETLGLLTDGLSLYLLETRSFPRLGNREERLFFQALQGIVSFAQVFQSLKIQSSPERSLVWQNYLQGYEPQEKDVREIIMETNLRLAVSRAFHFRAGLIYAPVLKISDLIQAGNLGLLEAIDSYDLERGTKFGTHAVWQIDNHIREELAIGRKGFAGADHLNTDVAMVLEAMERLTQVFQRPPALDELIEDEILRERFSDLSKKPQAAKARIIALLEYNQSVLSLDQPVSWEKEETLGEVLNLTSDFRSEEPGFKDELEQEIRHNFTAFEIKVLVDYYGLDSAKATNMSMIGLNVGFSREAIRLIRNRALGKLKSLTRDLELGEEEENLIRKTLEKICQGSQGAVQEEIMIMQASRIKPSDLSKFRRRFPFLSEAELRRQLVQLSGELGIEVKTTKKGQRVYVFSPEEREKLMAAIEAG